MSSKVQVVNSVLNGRGRMKRKQAEHYVHEGRAEWVGENQLRLILSHPKNQAAAVRAAAWQDECIPDPTSTRLSHAVARFPKALQAVEHAKVKFVPPECLPGPATITNPDDPDGERIPMFPGRVPLGLGGKNLLRETAASLRPALMREDVIAVDGKTGRQWHAYGGE